MGNSIDNMENPKLLSIFSLAFLALIWILTAAWINGVRSNPNDPPPSIIIVYLANAA